VAWHRLLAAGRQARRARVAAARGKGGLGFIISRTARRQGSGAGYLRGHDHWGEGPRVRVRGAARRFVREPMADGALPALPLSPIRTVGSLADGQPGSAVSAPRSVPRGPQSKVAAWAKRGRGAFLCAGGVRPATTCAGTPSLRCDTALLSRGPGSKPSGPVGCLRRGGAGSYPAVGPGPEAPLCGARRGDETCYLRGPCYAPGEIRTVCLDVAPFDDAQGARPQVSFVPEPSAALAAAFMGSVTRDGGGGETGAMVSILAKGEGEVPPEPTLYRQAASKTAAGRRNKPFWILHPAGRFVAEPEGWEHRQATFLSWGPRGRLAAWSKPCATAGWAARVFSNNAIEGGQYGADPGARGPIWHHNRPTGNQAGM